MWFTNLVIHNHQLFEATDPYLDNIIMASKAQIEDFFFLLFLSKFRKETSQLFLSKIEICCTYYFAQMPILSGLSHSTHHFIFQDYIVKNTFKTFSVL